jgi:ppGpp synthetase/RelA/SpoT-type nucleotidyltranferase
MKALDPDQYKIFLGDYEEYHRSALRPTYEQIRAMLSPWKKAPGYWSRYLEQDAKEASPSPVQRTITDLKRPESIVDKILRHPEVYPSGLCVDSLRLMSDAVRCRAVVYFLSGLTLVDCEIRRLINEKSVEVPADYVPVAFLSHDLAGRLGIRDRFRLSSKDSGYTSLHYILRFTRAASDECERPWFELQVRTLAEDAWGEIEHILGYKPEKGTSFAVKRQFWILSQQLIAIDEHFNALNEERRYRQSTSEVPGPAPLNVENLPSLLREFDVECAQSELDGLLTVLFSHGIETVGALREGASPRRLEKIRNIYLVVTGRVPSGFDVIATLAAMNDARDEDEEMLIRTSIDYLVKWLRLRSELKRIGV